MQPRPLPSTDGLGELLSPRYTAVLESRTLAQFEQTIVRFCRDLGFRTISATVVIDRPYDESLFFTADNTPESYRQIFEKPANFKNDPVMQHCRLQGTPIVWDQSTYVRCGQGHRWEQQALHGYRCGIAMALHLPRGRHFFVGLDRDQDLTGTQAELTSLVCSLSLFALHASQAAASVLAPEAVGASHNTLTAREREVLRWTLEGKTAWEIGSILAISERTAAIHANNAAHKLHCNSKHQAAVKALHFGWL